jgi:hypothetical protein
MRLLIRRLGTLIDVSPDGRSPLPEEVVYQLAPHLTYDHKTILRGHQQWDPATGNREGISIEARNLFRMEQGRLTTGYGFIPKLTRILQGAGHDVRFIDLSPERQRPDCYEPDWDNLHRHFEPRPRQIDCLQVIDQVQGGIINATMGFGKTHMFSALSWLYPRAKIAIVVKPKDVADRIVRRLTRDFPNVGHIGGGKKRKGERITVYTAGSIHHSDGDYDFLFCDEAHQLMSEKHSEDLGRYFRQTRNFGFTATPEGRLDGAHVKLEMFFGPEIFRLLYPEAVSLGLVVPIRVRWLPVRLDANPAYNKTGVSKMRWGIWRNQPRNAVFANDVRTTYGPDDQVLMAVATVDHAIHLWNLLPEFTLCYSNSENIDFEGYKRSGLLPERFQPITSDRRDGYRTAFEEGTLKKVIATDVWSTGVDFEQLQVLYRLDARESEILNSQWPGRVSRISEDKGYGEIVDGIDYFDKTFERKSQTRKRHYGKHEWEQDWPKGRRQNRLINA